MPDQAESTITIEPASRDQGAQVAGLIWSTHPTLHEDVFQGDRALQESVSKALWEADNTLESWQCSHVAMVDGEVIGVEIGGDMELVRQREEAEEAILKAHMTPESFTVFGTHFRDRWSYAFPRFPDGTYYVGDLAVAEGWQGKGVGRLLLQAAFDRAEAAGLRDVQLDLFATNPALHFYQAMGMEMLSETTVMLLQDTDTPTHYRMIKRFD